MSIDRHAARARLGSALLAWRRVAERVRACAEVRGKHPPHDLAQCAVCVARQPCVWVNAAIVAEADLFALADGFDLMSQLWSEVEELTRSLEDIEKCEVPCGHGLPSPGPAVVKARHALGRGVLDP